MSLHGIFEDAHRRVCIAKERGEIDRKKIWTGLTMPSEMKLAVKRDWMKPVCGLETRGVLNWYTFTDAGWAEYDRRYANAPNYFSRT